MDSPPTPSPPLVSVVLCLQSTFWVTAPRRPPPPSPPHPLSSFLPPPPPPVYRLPPPSPENDYSGSFQNIMHNAAPWMYMVYYRTQLSGKHHLPTRICSVGGGTHVQSTCISYYKTSPKHLTSTTTVSRAGNGWMNAACLPSCIARGFHSI